jgi:hypothetical protein
VELFVLALGAAEARHPDSRVLASLPLLVLPPEPAAELRGLFEQMLEEAAWQQGQQQAPGRGGGGGGGGGVDLPAARAFLAAGGQLQQQGGALGEGAAALLAAASSLGLGPLAQDVQLVLGAAAPAPPALLGAAAPLLGFLAERGCGQLVLLLLGRLEAAGVQLELGGAPVTSAAMSASGALRSQGSSPSVTGPAGGSEGGGWASPAPAAAPALGLLASPPRRQPAAAAAGALPLVVPEPFSWLEDEEDLPLSEAQLSSALLQPALFLSAEHSLATLAAIGAAGPPGPAESGTSASGGVLAARQAQARRQPLDSPFDVEEAEQCAPPAAGGSGLQGLWAVGDRQRELQAALAGAASGPGGGKGSPGGSGSAWCDSAAAHHRSPAARVAAKAGGGGGGTLLRKPRAGGRATRPCASDCTSCGRAGLLAEDMALVSDANNVVSEEGNASPVAAGGGGGGGGGLLLAGLAALVLAVVLAWLLGLSG